MRTTRLEPLTDTDTDPPAQPLLLNLAISSLVIASVQPLQQQAAATSNTQRSDIVLHLLNTGATGPVSR